MRPLAVDLTVTDGVGGFAAMAGDAGSGAVATLTIGVWGRNGPVAVGARR